MFFLSEQSKESETTMSYRKHIDAAQVRRMLLNIVRQFGHDHVAKAPGGGNGCTYVVVQNGVLVPVCIIGQLVANLGFLGILVTEDPGNYDSEDVAQHDACNIGQPMWDELANVGIVFTEDAKHYARLVQSAQDAGRTWSQAVQYGDAKFAEDKANAARDALGIDGVWEVSNLDFQSRPL
jgi:hypothetical protein